MSRKVRGEEFRKRENCVVHVIVYFSEFLSVAQNGFSFS